MERLSPIVQEAFGIQSRRIKREKGRYVCETASGPMSIYITHESPESIHMQHFIKECLAANGFPWTDRFQPAGGGAGQPYVQIGRDTYVMVKHPVKHRETDFENEGDVMQAFKFLAHFHTATKNIPAIAIPVSPPVTEIYDRHINELTVAGKQARRGPRMSDFDVSFIKHAPRYCEIMSESINFIENTNYTRLYAQAVSQNAICHNALKEENLLAACETTYITNFTESTTDIQLTDVAALIRRYAQRSCKSIPAGRLLEAYNIVNPLPAGAQNILYALLIFPWAFIKIITQYYSKKRNWTPIGLISRMEAILAERDDYEKYVETVIK